MRASTCRVPSLRSASAGRASAGRPPGGRRRTRRLTCLVLVVAAVVPSAGLAHSGGRAVPVATVSVRESGPLQALVDVRLRDEDGGEPVRGADVRGLAVMTSPHTMTTYFEPLPEVAPGRYRGRVKLPMTARWTIELQIGGDAVVAKTVRAVVVVDRSALIEARARTAARGARAAVGAADEPPAPIVSGTVRFDVTRREVTDMVVLWIHGIAATAWIVGLALFLLAATAGSGTFAPAGRARLGRWFGRRGLPLLWTAAAVVVATGVYNTVRITPFDLALTPGAFGRLSDVPYGKLYEAILVSKLVLFAVMLVAGILLVRRCRSLWDETSAIAGPGGVVRRLGVSGAVFVASAPAIVGAVVALRYVHILSHVAEAGGTG